MKKIKRKKREKKTPKTTEKGYLSDFPGLKIQSSRKQGKKKLYKWGGRDKAELKLDFMLISSLKRKNWPGSQVSEKRKKF